MEPEIIKAVTGIATTTTDKGIGKLTDLVFSKKLRQQRRLDHLSSTQDQKDAELIQQGLAEFRDGKFLLITDQIDNPTSPLGLILAQNNQNQATNLGQCLSKAYEYLSEKPDEQVSNEQVSETFFNKWINYGKEVSENELQDLWGNILATEVAEPNSINHLVLNTLSLMSKKHLEAFNDLLPFICDGNLYCDANLSAEENYQHIEPLILSELVDLNIIKGLYPQDVFFKKELPPVSKDNQKFPSIHLNQYNFIVLHPVDNYEKINPHFFLLTTVGLKLFDIAVANQGVENYFSNLISNLKKLPDFNHINTFELVSLVNHQWESIKKIQR